ncbi:MAG: phosphoglucosamine mutase, partial [Actinomycetota bacterium]|nr:phosphoglucosamine mutase [Actinomycetota bacterium]
NGRNINDDCGSTNPAKLKAAVQSSQADLGLAFDGDADRLIAVASDGAIIDGDRQLCLFANDMAQRDLLLERKVVITEMSNLGLRQALELADISTIEVPVGDRNILAQLEEGAATLGGEQSGHIVFWDYATTGDGLLSGALLADLVVRSGQPSSDLARDAMLQLPQVLVNVPVTVKSSDFPLKVQQEIQAAQDRLTDNGRVLVRASGTEALIRVMVEAPDERVARSEAQRLADVIQAAMR